MKRSTKQDEDCRKIPDEFLQFIQSKCSLDMSAADRIKTVDWFATAYIKSALVTLVLEGRLEIIGFDEAEGPRVREWKHSQALS